MTRPSYTAILSRRVKKPEALTEWTQHIGSTLVGISAIVSAVRSDVTLFFVFAAIFVLAIVVGPVLRKLRQFRCDRKARHYWSQLIRYQSHLGEFLENDRIWTLMHVIREVLQNRQSDVQKYYPSDYLQRLFPLLEERHLMYPARNERDLVQAMQELEQMVWLYNKDYFCTPLERLRGEPWKADISERHLGDIDSSRERWTQFLAGFESLAKELRDVFGNDKFKFRPYFERPRKL